MKYLVFALLAIIVAFFPVYAKSTTPLEENLLIIGWDGAGLDNVNELMQAGRSPNLESLLNQGWKILPLQPLTRTVTIPNWTVFFTGQTPDQSGVNGNKRIRSIRLNMEDMTKFNKFTGLFSFGTDFWIRQIPPKDFFFQYFKDAGYRIGWGTSKVLLSTNSEVSPFADFLITVDWYYLADTRKDGDVYIEELRQEAIQFISQCKQSGQKFAMFVHLNPDFYGHRFGNPSDRYLEEFSRSDQVLGDFQKVLPENTIVIVVSDHGFNKPSQRHPVTFDHKNAPYNFMATNLPINDGYLQSYNTPPRFVATMRDIFPTIMEYWGFRAPTLPQVRGVSLLSE